jgi:hypothetical protein
MSNTCRDRMCVIPWEMTVVEDPLHLQASCSLHSDILYRLRIAELRTVGVSELPFQDAALIRLRFIVSLGSKGARGLCALYLGRVIWFLLVVSPGR